jgi:hypothetical protein
MSSTKGTIGFDHLGIGTALKRNRLEVPPNQREYSWEKKHILELFQDFSKAIEENKSAYFLGTIVLTTSQDGALEVADGQQRLATCTILLAAIRDHFHDSKDELMVRDSEDFLFQIDRDARDIVPRLQLNVDDNEYFRRRILLQPDDPNRGMAPKFDSHRRIDTAAKLAAQHIQDILKPYSGKNHASLLNKWVSFIEKQAQVILLQVPDDLNAFVMFETLNDRGLRTSQADLLKNYLFGEARSRAKEAQQKWAAMNSVLEALGDDEIILTYLRHLAISLYGHTRERDVYVRIKESVKGQGQAIGFLDALAENANDYAAILQPDHHKWAAYDDNIREQIRALETLRVTQLRPLMLAVAKRFAPKEAGRAFRLFVRWSVRFLIYGGGRSGGVEETYAAIARDVTSGRITTAKQLITAVEKIVPNDKEFESAFAQARVSQSYLARYYLRTLEMKHKGQTEPELVPNESKVINLEHILPENPENNWPGIDEETAAASHKRIGNMVLLQGSKNAEIGNKSFAEKRPIFQKSGLALTSEVGAEARWGPTEINERQKRLAKLAVKTWPLSAD